MLLIPASASKSRLAVIQAVAYRALQNLKAKAEDAYSDMNDWLGARFLKEMERSDIYMHRYIYICLALGQQRSLS